ncbi:MAG: matrixin family metalloprotease [Thermoanaerobaculia bacterium]
MNKILTSKTLFVAFVSLLAAGSVSAFVLLNPPRTWDSAPTYVVDDRGMASITDNDGGVSATVNAIKSNQAWNGSGAGTVINAQAGSVANWQLGDGVPMLNFDDPEHACNGNCLAATFTGFFEQRNDGSSRIFDADIVTNDRFAWTSESEPGGCSSEFFIEGVQVHETGHGLGLGHTDVSGATMFPSVSSCNNGPATIEQDDEDGINALYGGGGPGGGDPPCDLGQKGDSCSSDGECCSGKCRGPSGNQTCK